MLAERLRLSGSFPLREKLLAGTPENSNADTRIYGASRSPSLRCDQLIYFAASIFWRAAITTWETQTVKSVHIDLDAALMAKLRDFLLGQALFPNDCLLVISVAEEKDPRFVMHAPEQDRSQTQWHQFDFLVPGMRVQMMTGGSSDNLKNLSITNVPPRIALTRLIRQSIDGYAPQKIATTKAVGSLKRKLEEKKP